MSVSVSAVVFYHNLLPNCINDTDIPSRIARNDAALDGASFNGSNAPWAINTGPLYSRKRSFMGRGLGNLPPAATTSCAPNEWGEVEEGSWMSQ